MVIDDERREIARRLRDDAKGGALPYSDFFGAVAYDVGVEKEHAAVLNRLADLIDPSCDREDLRSIADSMVRFSDSLPDTIEGICIAGAIEGYARRIREALAEKED